MDNTPYTTYSGSTERELRENKAKIDELEKRISALEQLLNAYQVGIAKFPSR